MIDLDFAVEGVEIARRSTTPMLLFKLRVGNSGPALPIEHVALQAQLRIEAAQRDYDPGEQEWLADLFGPPDVWSRGLRGLFWANVSVGISGFSGECTVDLPVPCSHDFGIAATRFLDGIEHGAAPLLFLFSGPIFFRNDEGDLQIAQIAHHKEAAYRLPAAVWRSLMAQHYPDSIWLRIDRDLFDAISRYRRREGLPEVSDALRALLPREPAEASR